MTDAAMTDIANTWLEFADQQDYKNTWDSSSTIFQSAIELDDWRKTLKAARLPFGAMKSRQLDSIEALSNPDGAPDGNYAKLVFSSVFEQKSSAQETITLVEEAGGQWRTAGYFIK